MENLRPNEELLLRTCKAVSELGVEALERLGLRKTKGYRYYYDGEGRTVEERDCIKDEELDALVGVEDYYVASHLLEDAIILTNIEQVDHFHEGDRNAGGCKCGGKCGCKGRARRKGGRRKRRGFRWGKTQRYVCGTWRYADCCDYTYYKRVPCGVEWCPECGKERSLYHRRLYLQILEATLKMWWAGAGAIGYMVITTTEELRERFKDNPKEMSKFARSIRRWLKRHGLWPVIFRWHFAGDVSKRWYPHLNLIFPHGYLSKELLDRFRKWLTKRWGIRDFHYQYTRSLTKIRHIARYVSRPTWNLQSEADPKKFKNFRKWGVWGGELLKMVDKVPDKHEDGEYWKVVMTLVSAWLSWNGDLRALKDLKDLVKKLEEHALEKGDLGFVKFLNALWGKGGIEKRFRYVVEELLALRGGPLLDEVVGYTVLHGRCIGCFGKLKWKWRKSPFITSYHKVFKVGWGVWVVLDKEYSPEDFPF